MKMKRDDLLMIILTIVVVLGGIFYFLSTQIQSDTSHSEETVSTTEPADGTAVTSEPTEGESVNISEANSEFDENQAAPTTSTIHVILNSLDRVIGGTLNGNWVDARTTGHYLKGGEVYQYYLDGKLVGERTSASFDLEKDYDTHDDTYWIQMQEDSDPISEYSFAMTGNWDPFPRKAQLVSDTGRFKPAVQKLLEERSMLNSEVVIREVYKIDVEGDGTPEHVIIASNCTETDADNLANGVEFSREDKYSFVILEKAGKDILLLERTQSIDDIMVTCADLDGDKIIEFLIHSENYDTLITEGFSTGFYSIMKLNRDTAVDVSAVTSTAR